MAGELATAFVRVRADGRGFKADLEKDVKSSFRSVSQIGAGVTGGIIAVEVFRDVGRAIRGIGRAASEEQVRSDLLAQSIENAGASAQVAGKDIEDLIDAESRLTGFTDQELSSALTRLVQATGDTGKAMDDLRLAEDVARVRKIELGQAAVALSKAEQGSATALARLGVILPKVHSEEARLTEQRDRAVASGAKFTKQQDLMFQRSLAVAKAHDAQATKTGLLATVQDRFGGSAVRFGRTATGALDRAEVSFNEFVETLGESFLPPLTAGALKLADLTHNLQDSEDAARGLQSVGSIVGDVFGVIGDAAENLGPSLAAAAHGAEQVVSGIGIGPLLAGAAAYKGIQLATVAAAGAEAFYARTVTAGAAARVEATAATVALTAAERAHLVSATASAGGLGLFSRGLGAMALGGGTPASLAILGLAGVATGIAILIARGSDLEHANENLRKSYDLLNESIDESKTAQQTLAQVQSSVPTDRLAVDAAKLAVEQAKANLAASNAAQGSVERRQLELQLQQALDQVRTSQQRLNADVAAVPELQDKAAAARQRERNALVAQRRAVEELRDAQQQRAINPPVGRTRGGSEEQRRASEARRAAAAVDDFAESIRKASRAQEDASPVTRRNGELLAQFAERVRRMPTDKEIRVILNNDDAKATLEAFGPLISGILQDASDRAERGGEDITVALTRGLRSGIVDANQRSTRAGQEAALDLLNGAKTEADKGGHDVGLTLNKAIAQGLIDSRSEVAEQMRATLAETIAQGELQITSAVVQAKQNLQSLGQSVADDVAGLIDAGPLGQRIAALQAQLDTSSRGDQGRDLKLKVRDAKRELEQARGQIATNSDLTPEQQKGLDQFLEPFKKGVRDAQSELKKFNTQGIIDNLTATAEKQKETVRKGLQEITDQYSRGLITLPQFNRRLAALLGEADINYEVAGRKLGLATVRGFKDKVQAIHQQVAALAGFVDRAGTGTGPSVVRPADTVEQVRTRVLQEQRDLQKEIRTNTKRMADELSALNKARAVSGGKRGSNTPTGLVP